MSEDDRAATRDTLGGWTSRLGPDFRVRLLSGLAPAVGAYRANITSMLRQV